MALLHCAITTTARGFDDEVVTGVDRHLGAAFEDFDLAVFAFQSVLAERL